MVFRLAHLTAVSDPVEITPGSLDTVVFLLAISTMDTNAHGLLAESTSVVVVHRNSMAPNGLGDMEMGGKGMLPVYMTKVTLPDRQCSHLLRLQILAWGCEMLARFPHTIALIMALDMEGLSFLAMVALPAMAVESEESVDQPMAEQYTGIMMR
jgi:hypothetical protein